jgi:hypothetical protein
MKHTRVFNNFLVLKLLFFTNITTIYAIQTDGPIANEDSETIFYETNLSTTRSCVTCACASGCNLTGAAAFCALQVVNDACIGSNLQVGGDLNVCGSIFTSGVVGTNYLFAYRAITQTLGVVAPTFADIIFTDSPILNGWVNVPPSAEFICPQTGNYLVEYDAICRITNSQLSQISIIAVLNGDEIPGSQGSIQQPNNNKPLALSRSFIASINQNDVFKLQFTGGTPVVQLEANSGNSSIMPPVNGVQPSITLTITRVS